MTLRAIRFSLVSVLTFISVNQAQWVPNGPWSASQVTSIDIVAGRIFATSYNGGIYRFNESAANWSLVNNGLHSTEMSDLAHIGTTLFAGARIRDLYRSTDSGNTWIEIGRGLSPDAADKDALARQARVTLTCVPGILYALTAFDSTLFACGCEGLFRSRDLGNNWTQAESLGMDTLGFRSIREVSGHLFAQPFTGPQLFRSTDGGISWAEVDSTVPFRGIVDAAEIGSKGFVITKTEIYLTEDTAKSWKQCATGTMLTDFEIPGDNNFTFITEESDALFLGTSFGKTYTSMDSGITWQTIEELPDDGVRTISNANGRMVILSSLSGEIYSSTDNGTTWTLLPVTSISDIQINYLNGDDNCLTAGDNATNIHISADNGENWYSFSSFYPLAFSGSIIVIRGPVYKILFSTDYGAIWNPIDTGESSDVRMEHAASNGSTIIGAFGNSVLRSTDKGTTWEEFTTGLSGHNITILETDGSFFYAKTSYSDDSGFYRSPENGTEWTAAGSPLTESIVYDIFAHNGLVLTTTEAQPSGRNVFLSTDHGESWHDITSHFPSENEFVSAAMRDSTIFSAFSPFPPDDTSQHTVYLSTDLGTSWAPIDAGLPVSEITTMSMTDTRLFVGTYGNGIWSRPLSDVVGIHDRHPGTSSGMKPASSSLSIATTTTSPVLRFSLSQKQKVSLSLFNLNGKRMLTLTEKVLPAGSYSYPLETRKLAKGCYTAVLKTAAGIQVHTIPVIR